ncbi:FliI/YscN family ATPase [Acetobacteraceae bacterium ESL0709]|nr:FliI/YscN family ATPase [Acetobacteraceae bacterium ESL0697]MDF7679020.1 FliI/YscN family ATPase [Acetobacteraceae bacterium ESL0709]
MSSVIHTATDIVPVGSLNGEVINISGLSGTVRGIGGFTGIGDRVSITSLDGRVIKAEIVAFQGQDAVVMAYDSLEGIGAGCPVSFPLYPRELRRSLAGGVLQVNDSWLGRVIDPTGRPLDGKGDLIPGGTPQKLHGSPPEAATRARLGPRIDLGVKAMNLFTTCRQGQRLGLFAGSGVGKSTLLGMLARNTVCDVAIISLVGERGREVREFTEDDLGPDGLKKAVVIVATSDTSALMRREAAYAALATAEYFRDQGKSVLLLMDSVTRFCQALREIGLSAGEPPATRGYPPSVFATLPRLLERAGPGPVRKDGKASGQITALFSVLVEGDDQNEPVSDAVRGILDGHVVMDREIADSGRYPAINVLKSLSRSVPGCNGLEENALVREARALLASWNDLRDLVRLGAYKAGSDPQADRAIKFGPMIEALITQNKDEGVSLKDAFQELKRLLQTPL